jgi:hypothetical protein
MLRNNLAKLFRVVRNEEGIALVTSLMLTLISLAIIMSLLYLITGSIQRTGAAKRYKTALEASYGGTEIFVKDLFPYIMRNYSGSQLVNQLQNDYQSVSATVSTTQQCLQAKLTKSTANWPAACSATLSPKSQPDLKLSLPGTNNQPFTVYSKIVDTVGGNTDISGLQLEGAGVAEAVPVITPQHFPYVYRLEVQAERASNATEQANISVLYAY